MSRMPGLVVACTPPVHTSRFRPSGPVRTLNHMAWLLLLVGLIGGGGIGGLLVSRSERKHASEEAVRERDFAGDQAREERAHASGEARAQRLWAFRLETYGAASLYLERQAAVLAWTDPMIGPAPEPPTIEPDDAYLALA